MCTSHEELEALDEPAWPQRNSDKRVSFWTGLTIFYEKRPGYEDKDQVRYIDTPVGLVETQMSHEEVTNVKDIFAAWGGSVAGTTRDENEDLAEVYLLKMKNNMKEQDPKASYEQEKMAFDHRFTYLLGPIRMALRPRVIRPGHIDVLSTYCRAVWSDCLTLEKMWLSGEIDSFVNIEEEELRIARSQVWGGSHAIFASTRQRTFITIGKCFMGFWKFYYYPF